MFKFHTPPVRGSTGIRSVWRHLLRIDPSLPALAAVRRLEMCDQLNWNPYIYIDTVSKQYSNFCSARVFFSEETTPEMPSFTLCLFVYEFSCDLPSEMKKTTLTNCSLNLALRHGVSSMSTPNRRFWELVEKAPYKWTFLLITWSLELLYDWSIVLFPTLVLRMFIELIDY